MLDKALDTIAKDSYYFQLHPILIRIGSRDIELPAPDTTYRFIIMKGTHSFRQALKNLTRTNFLFKSISDWLKDNMLWLFPQPRSTSMFPATIPIEALSLQCSSIRLKTDNNFSLERKQLILNLSSRIMFKIEQFALKINQIFRMIMKSSTKSMFKNHDLLLKKLSKNTKLIDVWNLH